MEMEKVKNEGAKFVLGYLILVAILIFFPAPVMAVLDDAKDMEPGTWAGTGGHRWLKFGKHTWRVLDVYLHEGRKHALLLAEEPVTVRAFDNRSDNWKISDIRYWLNNDFYRDAFEKSERIAIVIHAYRYGVFYEGNNKEDASKIFLLSGDEVWDKRYFADNADRIAHHRDKEGSLEDVFWWLRSPGDSWHRAAACVGSDGLAYYYSNAGHYVGRSHGIRPALIVNLSSPVFTSSSFKYETLYEQTPPKNRRSLEIPYYNR